jgi:hypothetical protein
VDRVLQRFQRAPFSFYFILIKYLQTNQNLN